MVQLLLYLVGIGVDNFMSKRTGVGTVQTDTIFRGIHEISGAVEE
jgi:hypothetical protein